VTISPGKRGEFTVWVDGQVVATKTDDRFPTQAECLEAVQAAL
jgi:predicted Rdx family selenoprotein